MEQRKKIAWQYLVLGALLFISLFLHFYMLEKEGYSNPYYSAAVQNMLDNPSAFFYGSFDSGLYVTVDKPAFGLWLEALSARVFGVNSFGLILPSALAGTLCVLLLFFIVRKPFGNTAGVIAAGIMTFTPILVAISRTNNLDVLLLFFLLCGALFLQHAVARTSLPLYLAAMACIGIGFNIKMLQAFLVVPAFVLFYLLGKGKLIKKIWHTVLALVVLAVVSFSWAMAVDLTPASERPYVGGSDTNSVIELALGYNGLSRLLGPQTEKALSASETDVTEQPRAERPAMQQGETLPRDPYAAGNLQTRPQAQNPGVLEQNNAENRQGGVGGTSENGETGIFRLFNKQLGGLASWFLLPALAMMAVGCVGIVRWLKKRKTAEWTQEQTNTLRQVIFWSAWLVPMAIFFSVAGFMHRYYVVMIAPATAALSAIAFVKAWNSANNRRLVPLVFLGTLAMQCVFVARTSWSWLVLPMLLIGVIAILLFTVSKKKLTAIAMALTLLIAPIAWSLTPTFGTLNEHIPDAGPNADTSTGGGQLSVATDALTDYITEHYAGERWALAVANANIAAPIALATGLPVMAVGGFNGGDQILTIETLQSYIADGSIRYFLISGDQTQGAVYQWVLKNATPIQIDQRTTLYDLQSAG